MCENCPQRHYPYAKSDQVSIDTSPDTSIDPSQASPVHSESVRLVDYRKELEERLLGKGAPGKMWHHAVSCTNKACQCGAKAANQTSAAWRQHIHNVLNRGKDG